MFLWDFTFSRLAVVYFLSSVLAFPLGPDCLFWSSSGSAGELSVTRVWWIGGGRWLRGDLRRRHTAAMDRHANKHLSLHILHVDITQTWTLNIYKHYNTHRHRHQNICKCAHAQHTCVRLSQMWGFTSLQIHTHTSKSTLRSTMFREMLSVGIIFPSAESHQAPVRSLWRVQKQPFVNMKPSSS